MIQAAKPAMLLFLGFWKQEAGHDGALGSCATYVAPVTLIPFLPDAWAAPAGGFPAATLPYLFLMKYIVLLAASLGPRTQTVELENALEVREQHSRSFCALACANRAVLERTSQAAAGNGIFVVGDRRPKTCLRDETYAQRRKSRPHDREKPAENRPFRS